MRCIQTATSQPNPQTHGQYFDPIGLANQRFWGTSSDETSM